MVDWLTYKPCADDLARGLVIDYLRQYGASRARFALLAEDDSLHHIGSYGFDNTYRGVVETGSQWRARQDKAKEVLWNDNFIGWNSDHTVIGAAIRECGSSKGSIVIEFSAPVLNHEQVLDIATKLSRLIGFYLCTTYSNIFSANVTGKSLREVSRNDFTSRQLHILQGMADGLTNHELATQLGYSVSTVRHETMRIFQILGVSDRREAGQAALERSIL